MFVFLSKKIAIPNGAKLHSLAWNSAQGWIACGGENGLLKVLKLDTSADSKARGVAAPSNLSMNQTLEGHQGAVMCCTWNATHSRLTTSDENGLIIVWMLHNHSEWYEEMINNREKSVVKSMKWSPDGQRICIAYADGSVIVGGVDGNRIWARDLGMELVYVEWAPDGRSILFVNQENQVVLFDDKGNKLAHVVLHIGGSEERVVEEVEDAEEDDFEGEGKQATSTSRRKGKAGQSKIAGLHWYDGTRGHIDPDAPDLAIALSNGRVQITKGVALGNASVKQRQQEQIEQDKRRKTGAGGDEDEVAGSEQLLRGDSGADSAVYLSPVLIDTGLQLSQVAWNANGTILALAGTQETSTPSGEKRRCCMVQFYSPFGHHLRSLKVPGNAISALTWEGSGLRIALAVDSFIYFANLRLDYRWGYFGNTLCYAYNRPERPDATVVFWDTHTDERNVKSVKRLTAIRAYGENAVLASRSDASGIHLTAGPDREVLVRQYTLTLCDAIGSPVDLKEISVEPLHLCMTSTHVVAANEWAVYVWNYKQNGKAALVSASSAPIGTLQASLIDVTGGGAKQRGGKERVFHVDTDPARSCVAGLALLDSADAAASSANSKKSAETRSLLQEVLAKGTSDAIVCIAASDKCLIVARESGTVLRYTLPHVALEHKFVVKCRPQQISLNCNSSKLAIIDINNVLTTLDIEKGSKQQETVGEAQPALERKDAWDVAWATENPDLLAVMEKTRLYVLRNGESEEPVLSSGYLAVHSDLQIKACMLDEILAQPATPSTDMVVDFPTKSLRDVREMLKSVGVADAFEYVEAHPHPRLWRLLAEGALERLEFGLADKAFVRCGDYAGIQFVKRLKNLNDKVKQRAQVAAYFERFDEAEALYRDIDRKDLAIDLRITLGDWFRVVQLAQGAGGAAGSGDDQMLRTAWGNIGEYYAARQKWSKAVQYFASAKSPEQLVECYYRLEEYASLEKLVRVIPENSPLLANVGAKLQAVGMSEAACAAFLKGGDVKAAIDCCVLLNDWDKAVQLAEEHEFPQIEGLLAKYASHLLEKGDKLQAIELYRKASKSTQAASLLASLAQEVGRTKVNPVSAKKLHVLAAIEMDELRVRVLDTQLRGMGMTMTGGDLSEAEAKQRADDDFELGTMSLKPKSQRTMMNTTLAGATAATLDSLVQHDAATGENRSLDNAWHGAEGIHLFMLAQRQLYANKLIDALGTALQLRAYQDVLEPKEVHSLIALTAYYNEAWGQCSKAFVELESLKGAKNQDKEKYADLALKIFSQNRPQDPSNVQSLVESINKGRSLSQPVCMMTGRTIDEKAHGVKVYKCRRCARKMLEDSLRGCNHCPLCHMMLA